MIPAACPSIHGCSPASPQCAEKETQTEKEKEKEKAKAKVNQPQDRLFILTQLKSCTKERNLWKIRRIHAHMNRSNSLSLPHDLYLATSLVNAYAKCGSFGEALDVFERLPIRNVVSWNALISGYAQHGLGEIAFKCFRDMKDEGIAPNTVTYVCMLKACGSIGNLHAGETIESEVKRQGFLRKDVALGNSLIDMYMKCGALEKARDVFEELPLRDAITWTTLITGYAQHGLGHEALSCFQQMQDEGVFPNAVTYMVALRACGIVRSLDIGEDIHTAVKERELFPGDVMLSTSIVDMYAKCYEIEKAQEVFDQISKPNVVCWNALISGYVLNGLGNEAWKCFKKMQDDGVSPNELTYICILKVCGNAISIEVGEELHAEIRKQGLLMKDPVLGTTLIDMYAKHGALDKAQSLFEELPHQSTASWNALLSGYVQYGYGVKALTCFRKLKAAGLSADRTTYICILKACRLTGSLDVGEEIIAEVQKQGLLQKDIALGNAIVDMFAKCGAISKAQEAFRQLPLKNTVSWTVMIAGYAQHKLGDEALESFKQMQVDGFSPDAVTYICILKVCAAHGSLEIGEEIGIEVRRKGFLEKEDGDVLGSILVDMYAKCGAIHKAREVFDKLPTRNLAAWTALIAGYTQHRLGDEALQCFKLMQDEGITPDAVTYASALKACGISGSLSVGEDIEVKIRKQELFEKDTVLGNALVGMYGKCGALDKAQEVFEQLPVPDIVSWNALLAGYGQLGRANMTLNLFEKMRVKGIVPDRVTVLVLLMACGHAGLMEDGECLFKQMYDSYRLEPAIEHYTCMIDLFGRAGHFDRAMSFIDKVSSFDDLPLFVCMLCACHRWGNAKLGRWALEQLARLDKNAVTLSSMDSISKIDEVGEAWKLKNRRLANARNWIDANIVL